MTPFFFPTIDYAPNCTLGHGSFPLHGDIWRATLGSVPAYTTCVMQPPNINSNINKWCVYEDKISQKKLGWAVPSSGEARAR